MAEEGEGCFSVLIPPLVAAGLMLLFAWLSLAGAPSFSVTTEEYGPSPEQLATFFTPQVQRWETEIVAWAATYALPPNLVAVVMQIESCGDPLAVSPAGARGLFQVMPYHFAPGEDPFDPHVNARRGLAYLQRAWLQTRGDPAQTLAAYNGGLGLIGREEASWPAETQRYVYWGAAIYADAQAGRTHSARLQEWLQSGGHTLCEQAAAR